jgi:hypothetical protein
MNETKVNDLYMTIMRNNTAMSGSGTLPAGAINLATGTHTDVIYPPNNYPFAGLNTSLWMESSPAGSAPNGCTAFMQALDIPGAGTWYYAIRVCTSNGPLYFLPARITSLKLN